MKLDRSKLAKYLCCRCKQVRPFAANKARESGRNTYCVDCSLEYARALYHRTKHRIGEAKNASHRKSYRKHAEARKAYAKEYRDLHPGTVKQNNAASYARDKAGNQKRVSAWYKAHPEKFRVKSERRRARVLSLPSSFTVDDWEFIKSMFDFCCAYCGTRPSKLVQEHFVPVARGGGYVAANILPACRSCNSKKRAADPRSWIKDDEKFERLSSVLRELTSPKKG